MLTCANCGRPTSEDYVALADECPRCKTSPFAERAEPSQVSHTRQRAAERGIIEARDLQPGDVILTRCPGDVDRTPHTVKTVEWAFGNVEGEYDCDNWSAHRFSLSPRMPATLLQLAKVAK